jgi:hypothetical protein
MDSVGDTLAGGLPHSEIPGSKIARISPGLNAACHVLHRLSVPRHPPDALKLLDSNPSGLLPTDQTQNPPLTGTRPATSYNNGSSWERRFTLKTLLPHETDEHSRGCSQLAPDTPWRTRRPSRSHFSLHMSKNEPSAVAAGMAVLPRSYKN